jgi:VanZ family protein
MFFRYNLFAFSWSLIILMLTLAPGKDMPEVSLWDLLFDKAAHSFVFAILSFLLVVGFIKQGRFHQLKFEPIRYSLIFSIGYGVLIEIVQGFVPGRSLDWKDMLADASGALIGILLFYVVYKI